MFSVSGKAIHARAHQEVRSLLLCGAEKLVNVTLAVSNVNATLRVMEECRGLSQVFQPADTFFFLDRYSRRINSLLERVAPVELFTGPKLHGRQPQRKSSDGRCQTGMHQNATDNVVLQTPVETLSGGSPLHNTDGLDILAVIVEFRCVMENQNRYIGCGESLARGLEMPCQNVTFADARIGKETVRCFCVFPVLANQRNALAGALGELLEKLSKPLVEPGVFELAAGEFAIDPGLGLGSSGVINCTGALRLLPLRHSGSSAYACLSKDRRFSPWIEISHTRSWTYRQLSYLWVIESRIGRLRPIFMSSGTASG
jgi:hypothetical protein